MAPRQARNPFYVLGLGTDASRVDVEREGAKLLSMLEVGIARARTFLTPVGGQDRTPEAVREAMATLREPDKRLLQELWAAIPADPVDPIDDAAADAGPSIDVWEAAGWRS